MSKCVTISNEIMLGSVKELVAEGHPVIIMTKGVSMLPFIEGKKDSVLLEKRGKVIRGDIALAEIRPGRYVLHRVIKTEGDEVTLKGDGNSLGMEHCFQKNIAGVVAEIQRPGRDPVDPSSAYQQRRWRLWVSIPAVVRRYYLGFYRRIKHITI